MATKNNGKKQAEPRAKAPRGGKQLPKIFVLDTNVLLHDYHAIYKFQDNDIVIPMVDLEEVDHFKKGNEQINFNAREIMRALDKLSEQGLFGQGVSLGKGMGTLTVMLGKGLTDEMKAASMADIPDHRILAVALDLQKAHPERKVRLVTKDVNLRMKAKSLGMPAEDYLSDKTPEESEYVKRKIGRVKVAEKVIASLYERPEGISPADIKVKPAANEYFELVSGEARMPVMYNALTKNVVKVSPLKVTGISPRNDEQACALDALMRPDIPLVALTGVAGTGKTLLALAAALAQMNNYKSVLLSRPVIPLKNQDMGFLPGDANEKLGPYMLPLYDNLAVIKNKTRISTQEYTQIEEMQKSGAFQITPLAYIRGRSLSDTYFIIDEAQNLTPHEVKTIITRAGEGTKLVFTGDIHQIDSLYLDARSNGLSYLCDRLFGQDIFAHVNLRKGERSRLAEIAGKLL
ncbi:MAG: PhoH family protein [Bacteroides sp.]|nr:PhoH family protein [Ruminococcus flavefaciens]MCM1553938.1 PhoH family protein [Bacteroides sp.]